MNWKHLLALVAVMILGAVIQAKTGIFKKIPVIGGLL